MVIGVPVDAGAADGRVFEPNSPPNGRAYWLAGDEIEIEVACLDDEYDTYRFEPDAPGGGTMGPDGFNGGVDLETPPGTYEIIVTCVDRDTDEPREEFVATYDVHSPFQLVATVGTEQGECAMTDEITVEAGTEVFWCYRLVPDPLRAVDVLGWYETVEHVVSDTADGPLGSVTLDYPDAGLPDGGLSTVDLGLASSSIADQPMESTGTWGVTVGYTYYDPDTQQDMFAEVPVAELDATARVGIVGADVPNLPGPDDDPAGDPGRDDGSAPPAAPVPGTPAYTG